MDESILLHIEELESEKVKFVCKAYLELLYLRLGAICEFYPMECSVTEQEFDQNRVVLLVINAVVKDNSVVICRQRGHSLDIDLPPHIENVLYVDPTTLPYSTTIDREEMVNEIRESLENSLRRMDTDTTIDGHLVNCMVFIDDVSFSNQIYF